MTLLKFVPTSAWGQTPAQRIARLRRYLELSAGRQGNAAKQAQRYRDEIAEIEETKETEHERRD